MPIYRPVLHIPRRFKAVAWIFAVPRSVLIVAFVLSATLNVVPGFAQNYAEPSDTNMRSAFLDAWGTDLTVATDPRKINKISCKAADSGRGYTCVFTVTRGDNNPDKPITQTRDFFRDEEGAWRMSSGLN